MNCYNSHKIIFLHTSLATRAGTEGDLNNVPEYNIIYTTRTNDIHGKIKTLTEDFRNFKIMTEKDIINLTDYEIDNLRNKKFILI